MQVLGHLKGWGDDDSARNDTPNFFQFKLKNWWCKEKLMTVYSKMVQAYPPDSGWCEYPDGHLQVRIFYSGDFNKCPVEKKPWCIFSVWGWDDTGMEINEYVSGDKEANELISKWLEIYHEMPKHLSMEWLEDRGFEPA